MRCTWQIRIERATHTHSVGDERHAERARRLYPDGEAARRGAAHYSFVFVLNAAAEWFRWCHNWHISHRPGLVTTQWPRQGCLGAEGGPHAQEIFAPPLFFLPTRWFTRRKHLNSSVPLMRSGGYSVHFYNLDVPLGKVRGNPDLLNSCGTRKMCLLGWNLNGPVIHFFLLVSSACDNKSETFGMVLLLAGGDERRRERKWGNISLGPLLK